MMTPDEKNILELLQKQYSGLSWDESRPANWELFLSGFHPEGRIIPSARPIKIMSPQDFVERMSGLKKRGVLRSFSEQIKFYDIQVYGNVACAIVGCEMTENKLQVTHDISVINLLKEQRWVIISQSWTSVSEEDCHLCGPCRAGL
ncbi:hypothetical protein [uncultured Pseudoteredinibacter sp.]|uniref:hypothetical protein n=1 Tax=uncultured Pseudoteredinibacter sp. TaxID=1641701 RepID=UPI002637C03E|nr:hypothetical protein [uncultured Pseudoteredinibacter sp.]